eukprot:6071285-Amphidinium_carterae.1
MPQNIGDADSGISYDRLCLRAHWLCLRARRGFNTCRAGLGQSSLRRQAIVVGELEVAVMVL